MNYDSDMTLRGHAAARHGARAPGRGPAAGLHRARPRSRRSRRTGVDRKLVGIEWSGDELRAELIVVLAGGPRRRAGRQGDRRRLVAAPGEEHRVRVGARSISPSPGRASTWSPSTGRSRSRRPRSRSSMPGRRSRRGALRGARIGPAPRRRGVPMEGTQARPPAAGRRRRRRRGSAGHSCSSSASTKEAIWDCRMCGQCILHSTGLSCPMRCPKNLRNGPCGGMLQDGSCEVLPEMTMRVGLRLGGLAATAAVARSHRARRAAGRTGGCRDVVVGEPAHRTRPARSDRRAARAGSRDARA